MFCESASCSLPVTRTCGKPPATGRCGAWNVPGDNLWRTTKRPSRLAVSHVTEKNSRGVRVNQCSESGIAGGRAWDDWLSSILQMPQRPGRHQPGEGSSQRGKVVD